MSKFPYVFDADAAVTLRDVADGAETSTASEAGISLNVNGTAYWASGDAPYRTMAVVVHVTAVDDTTGDEAYTFSVETDSQQGFGDSPVAVASLPDIGGAAGSQNALGYWVMLLDTDTMAKLDADATHIRITCTIAGTTPSITYAAWLQPVM